MARLLLLDNDVRILELFALYLGQRGHVVRTVSSFRAAREALREEQPDLLLSDLELGAESGRVELPLLWKEGLLPPTLVVSGFVDAELQRFFAGIPAIVGCLPKPFDLERLDASLADALERARAVGSPVDDGWTEVLPDAPRARHGGAG